MATIKIYNQSTQQWEYASIGKQGPTGADGKFIVSDTMPVSAVVGDAWFDSSTSRTYVYMVDSWVEVIGAAGPAGTDGIDGVDGGFNTAQTVATLSSNYTIQSTDAGKLYLNSAAVSVTINDVLQVGQQIDFLQSNASQITFVLGSIMGLYSKDGNKKTAGQWSAASIKCIAPSEYVIVGDLVA